MKKVLAQVTKQPGSPAENELWIDDSKETPVVKVFDRGEWKKVAGGGDGSGLASSLSDMTDVDISSPSDGDTLVYNATTHKWENGSGSGCQCLPPMIVEGAITGDFSPNFIPLNGQPTYAQAKAQIESGGLVWLKCKYEGRSLLALAYLLGNESDIEESIAFNCFDQNIAWMQGSSNLIPLTIDFANPDADSNKWYINYDDSLNDVVFGLTVNNPDPIIYNFAVLSQEGSDWRGIAGDDGWYWVLDSSSDVPSGYNMLLSLNQDIG